jgi:hypothetical protein
LEVETPRQSRPIAFVFAIVFVCLIALAGIVFFAVVDQALVGQRLAATTYDLFLEGLAVLACATLIGRGRYGTVGLIGIAVSVIAFGFLAAFDWTDYGEFPYSEGLYKASQSLLIVSLGYGAGALLISRGPPLGDGGITRATWLTLVATAGVVTLVSVAAIGDVSDAYYWRITASVTALWALGISVVTILRLTPRT